MEAGSGSEVQCDLLFGQGISYMVMGVGEGVFKSGMPQYSENGVVESVMNCTVIVIFHYTFIFPSFH